MVQNSTLRVVDGPGFRYRGVAYRTGYGRGSHPSLGSVLTGPWDLVTRVMNIPNCTLYKP